MNSLQAVWRDLGKPYGWLDGGFAKTHPWQGHTLDRVRWAYHLARLSRVFPGRPAKASRA